MATLATASMTDTATRGTNDLPFMLPGRPKMRYDFAKAWRHFRELVKDKENTAEVFPIFEALPWRGVYDAARVPVDGARSAYPGERAVAGDDSRRS
jgi:ubiquinone biosynthesis protein COQ4